MYEKCYLNRIDWSEKGILNIELEIFLIFNNFLIRMVESNESVGLTNRWFDWFNNRPDLKNIVYECLENY